MVERGAPNGGGSRQNGPSRPEIRLESTKKGKMAEVRRHWRAPAAGRTRRESGRSDGPSHLTARGWKHKEPLGGGPVSESEWTRPEVGQAEEHRWRRQRMDWYNIVGRGAHGANPLEQVPCPQCGKKVQRRYLRKHERSQHEGVWQRRHACAYCTA